MAPNKTDFRWTPEEEAWLLTRVIDDAGRSKKDGKQAQWQKSIVGDFEDAFPCRPRSKVGGVVETGEEMMQRWNESPRRIRRWIGNHQESVLKKHVENKPQNLLKRLAPKRTKNLRSKNARDMAKAHHPDLKAKWMDLHQQFKDRKIPKSEMLAEYNKAVTVLLEDEHWKTHYTAMANRQEPIQKPSVSASTETNTYNDSTLTELQIVHYIPPLLMSTATEANGMRVERNEPGAHWEHERRDSFDASYLGIQQGGSDSGEPALIPPHPPPRPASRDDAEAMLIGSRCPKPPAPDRVLSRVEVIASQDRVPQPMSYALQQTTFHEPSLQSIGMGVDTSYNFPSFVSYINEWPAHHVTTPRTVEAFQLHQTLPDLTNRHAYTSSSMVYSLDTHGNPPTQPSHVQSCAYNTLTLPQITDDSHTDQNRPPHTIESHNSSPIDIRSTSSNSTITASRDRFKDWSPAGDWHLQKVFRGHTHIVLGLAFSHNRKLLASGSDDCTIRVWNVETGETVLRPLKGHTHLVCSVAFSPDDRRIVSGSRDGVICIWVVQTGEQLLKFEEYTGCIHFVAFSSDGSRVACSCGYNILVLDVDSKRRVGRLKGHKYCVTSLYFSCDDRFIAGIAENVLTIWDVECGKRVPISLQAGSFSDHVWFGECSVYAYMDGDIRQWFDKADLIAICSSALSPDRKLIAAPGLRNRICLYSRDPSPEELASVDDIEDELCRFTLLEDSLSEDLDYNSEYDA